MIIRNVLWSAPRKDGTQQVKIYAYDEGTRQKDYYQTKIYIKKPEWDEAKQEVNKKHPLAALYNAKIKEVREKVETHFLMGGTFGNWEIRNSNASIIELGEKVIKQKYIEHQEGGIVQLKDSTLKKYAATIKYYRDFCNFRGYKDLLFSNINMQFYRDFQEYLIAYTNCQKKVSLSNHIKNTKALMGYGFKLGIHSNTAHRNKDFRVYKNKGSNKIYLTEDEIKKIEALDLSFNLPLEQERDRWLISYYFIFRFSDVYEKISIDKVFQNENGRFIRIFHKKTGKEVILPVKERAFSLLERYNYDFGFTGNQQANKAIKHICAIAGLTNIETEGDRSAPKCELVGTHTARRSAATNLYLQGVSLKMIADLGGWESEEVLKVYLRASGLDTAKAAQNIDFFK